MRRMPLRSIVAVFLLFIFAFTGAIISPANAQADSLVVQTDGIVVLITGDDILGVSLNNTAQTSGNQTPPSNPAPTTKPTTQSSSLTPPANTSSSVKPSIPTTPSVKAVPITTPNTTSIIKTSPPTSENGKLKVSISTTPNATVTPPKSQPSSVISPTVSLLPTVNSNSNDKRTTLPGTTSTGIPTLSPQPTGLPTTPPSSNNSANSTTTISKDVSKVIVEGQLNQSVVTIKTNTSQNSQNTQTPQMIVQQGSTEITTSLPLQIDTNTHSISTVLSNGITRLNVLPEQAVQGVVSQGLVTNININNQTNNSSNAKVSLEEDNNQVVYKVQGERSGNLFGIFPVTTPVEVKLSAQTGNIVGITQSFTFNIFGAFIH